MEADFQAQEQAEGNQPQNILCFAFPPSALNALPREDRITVIRGNNSQSGVFFGDAPALSKIMLVLHGEARVSSKRDAAGDRAGAAGRAAGAGGAPGQPGLVCCERTVTGKTSSSCTRYFMKKTSCQNKSDVTLVVGKVGRKKLRFKLSGKPSRKLI